MADRVDDPSVTDDTILWRRVLPDWLHKNEDGSYRPQSIAFVDRGSHELSVHISHMTTPQKALAGFPDDSLASFTAGFARSLGFKVVPDSTPVDPSHALICPSPTGKKAKKFAKESTWVVLKTAQ